MAIEAKELIVTTCAVIGAGLGIFNLFRNYLADSERIRVAVWSGGQERHPSVEIINVSPFPITIMEICTVHLDGQIERAGIEIRDMKAEGLPQRVEPRHSHTFHLSLRQMIAQQIYNVQYTFVRTALGNVFTSEPTVTRWKRRALETIRLKAKDL